MQERVEGEGEEDVGSYAFDFAEKAEDSYSFFSSSPSSNPRLSVGR